MAPTLENVLEAALRLPRDHREQLLGILEDSLDDDRPISLSPEWMAEIRRRWAEYEQGKVKCYSWEEVKKSVAEELRDETVPLKRRLN